MKEGVANALAVVASGPMRRLDAVVPELSTLLTAVTGSQMSTVQGLNACQNAVQGSGHYLAHLVHETRVRNELHARELALKARELAVRERELEAKGVDLQGLPPLPLLPAFALPTGQSPGWTGRPQPPQPLGCAGLVVDPLLQLPPPATVVTGAAPSSAGPSLAAAPKSALPGTFQGEVGPWAILNGLPTTKLSLCKEIEKQVGLVVAIEHLRTGDNCTPWAEINSHTRGLCDSKWWSKHGGFVDYVLVCVDFLHALLKIIITSTPL